VRQFDVVKNANPATRGIYPYVLILQSDLLSTLVSRVVAPLVPVATLPRGGASGLNPVMEIPGGEHVLLTQQMSGVPLSSLKGPAVCNLAGKRDEILAAIDRVFVGF